MCQDFHRTVYFIRLATKIHRRLQLLSVLDKGNMPGPSNTLLIEGSFSELVEELAQYLDTVNKSDPSSGIQNEIAPALAEIRETEQAEEPVDSESTQKQRDELLKKVVGKASVLNSAPEKGQLL